MVTLVLEVLIIATAPWFFWVADLPFRAGVTFISEYSFIIALRLIVVLIFQRSLLVSIINLLTGLGNRLLEAVRMLAYFSPTQQQSEEHSSLQVQQPPVRGVGRPRKS